MIPKQVTSILDIGCGDGQISSLIVENRPDLSITGLEILKRRKCSIKCKLSDGKIIPLKNSSVDLCLLVDVLHHTTDIQYQLAEAKRVSKRYIIIKDHIYSNFIFFLVLKFMDWIGNRPYGVNLTYNYLKKHTWLEIFKSNDLRLIDWNDDLLIYPPFFNYIFGKKRQFMVLLDKKNGQY